MNALASEAIRQKRATFNQLKEQDRQWFRLRLVMGYCAILLLLAVFVVAAYVVLRADRFSATIAASATAALFVDIFGLIVLVWKVALPRSSVPRLSPTVTDRDESL